MTFHSFSLFLCFFVSLFSFKLIRGHHMCTCVRCVRASVIIYACRERTLPTRQKLEVNFPYAVFLNMSCAVEEQEWEYDEAEDVYYTEELNDVSLPHKQESLPLSSASHHKAACYFSCFYGEVGEGRLDLHCTCPTRLLPPLCFKTDVTALPSVAAVACSTHALKVHHTRPFNTCLLGIIFM